jgi:putative ATPase
MPTIRTKASGAKPEALFQPPPSAQPLAARMRPRTLDEFVGQEHLVGERGPLRRSVERGQLGSLLLWGPPGSGKTTLARLLAEGIGARFTTMSAVMSGVADVRSAIAAAQDQVSIDGSRTVLFID